MLLEFRDDRLDFWQFPDLMAERFEIDAAQRLAATPAFSRQAGNDFLALFCGNQRSFVFFVAGLAAGPSLRLPFRLRRLGMWMRRRRWFR